MPGKKHNQKRHDIDSTRSPLLNANESSSRLESLNITMKDYTLGEKITFDVANGKKITLPELNEEQIELVQKEVCIEYMRNAIHHPNWVGWPDATHDYKNVGFVLQALNHNTARVLLVIDDAPVLDLLALQYGAYRHWGYTLHIDEATVLRPHLPPPEYEEDETAAEPPQQTAPKTDLLGMEVA
ncbi:MAG: hypothetical protein P8Q40_03205 [Candidatus Poseidonia sp.]|uniref:hypothetical protein n=1 Tax=Poseidonia sp. TaxID=2666344 RepID=UPI0030C284F2|nr:hypothetical protein [Poseidonia sp.]